MTLPGVDVLMGGPGGETEVSRRSGVAIADALESKGVDVRRFDVGDAVDIGALDKSRVVFNIIHGHYGEDGRLQAQLDAAGLHYVGSGPQASALCLDKHMTKDLGRSIGLMVPWGLCLLPDADLSELPDGPLVVKPANDGSSVGLRFVESAGELREAIQQLWVELGDIPLLVEERLAGPEYTVAVLESGEGPRALPPICIRPADGVYDYDAKYQRNDTVYESIDAQNPLTAPLQDQALALYAAAGCRHLARVDFMADGAGTLRLLEANTLPGFTDHSLVPKAAAATGMDFPSLCVHLVKLVTKEME